MLTISYHYHILLPDIINPPVSVYFNLRLTPIIGVYSLRVNISIYLIFNQPDISYHLKISLNADV